MFSDVLAREEQVNINEIREFSIAVNAPLVNGVERMSARKSHACIPLYMHYNTYRSTSVQ